MAEEVFNGKRSCIEILGLVACEIGSILKFTIGNVGDFQETWTPGNSPAQQVELLTEQYKTWDKDDVVSCLLIKGYPKAFCAGGDVKTAVLNIRNGHPFDSKRFFKEEYKLDYRLATLSKPHIALIDGVVMGGGAGLSVHGPFRIATERTVFAMPETGIGLFPDVGASYFLPRLRGFIGTYLGVTGARLRGVQALEAGVATHFMASDKLEEFLHELIALNEQKRKATDLEQLLSAYQAASKDHMTPSGLLEDQEEIDAIFCHDSMEGIEATLSQCLSPWAKEANELLSKGSKLSQKITLRAIRQGSEMSLADCLKMEYRLAANIVDSPAEFDEGIRALLIDKDSKPKWKPDDLRKVSKVLIDGFFKKLPPEEELNFMDQRSKL